MNDCPREFDCDSCILRGSLDCPAEYNSENEDRSPRLSPPLIKF